MCGGIRRMVSNCNHSKKAHMYPISAAGVAVLKNLDVRAVACSTKWHICLDHPRNRWKALSCSYKCWLLFWSHVAWWDFWDIQIFRILKQFFRTLKQSQQLPSTPHPVHPWITRSRISVASQQKPCLATGQIMSLLVSWSLLQVFAGFHNCFRAAVRNKVEQRDLGLQRSQERGFPSHESWRKGCLYELVQGVCV